MKIWDQLGFHTAEVNQRGFHTGHPMQLLDSHLWKFLIWIFNLEFYQPGGLSGYFSIRKIILKILWIIKKHISSRFSAILFEQ